MQPQRKNSLLAGIKPLREENKLRSFNWAKKSSEQLPESPTAKDSKDHSWTKHISQDNRVNLQLNVNIPGNSF